MKRFCLLLLALVAYALYCAWPPTVGGYLVLAPTGTATATRTEYVQALPTATPLPDTPTPRPSPTRRPAVRVIRHEIVPTLIPTPEPTLVPLPRPKGCVP